MAKIEEALEIKLKTQAKRYNKDYPGWMLHGDTKRLTVLKGESIVQRREYLFVAIDDFSRERYAAILPDKTQYSAKAFFEQVIEECSYTIEQYYTDNGKEYRGDPARHAFMWLCKEQGIKHGFTNVRKLKTNGKAKQVIRTIIELWHEKIRFTSSAHRKTELKRFIHYYNGVRPHKALQEHTSEDKLIKYFLPRKTINNAGNSYSFKC